MARFRRKKVTGVKVLDVDITQVGTDADTVEKILYTYDIPANTLNANGKFLKFHVFGTLAANVNSKTKKVYLGGTVLYNRSTTASGKDWSIKGVVIRVSKTSQKAIVECMQGTAAEFTNYTSLSLNTGQALTFKMTGTNAVASANDIVKEGAIVEVIK